MKKTLSGFTFVLMISFLLTQCGKEKIQSLESEVQNQLELLPETTTALAYINIAAIRTSVFFSMMDTLPRNPFRMNKYRDFVESTGLDVRKDLDKIYITFTPGEEQFEKDVLIVAKGVFDSQKILEFLSEKNMDETIMEENYKGSKVYTIGDRDMIFSFPDNQTLVIGKADMLKAWLANFKEGASDRRKTKWVERVKKMKYKNGICFSMDAQAMVEALQNQFNQMDSGKKFPALQALVDLNFSANMDENFKFDGNGHFTDSEKAKLFYDAIKGMLATVKISVSDDREKVDILNKIKIDQTNSDISVVLNLSRAEIKKLMEKPPKVAKL
jgi:hypothetical protein